MITLQDIADKAGVSKGTVSYVLSGKHKQAKISDATSEKIKILARQMGYRANALAKGVATGQTKVIGFLTRVGSSEHLNAIISGMQKRMSECGYLMKFLYVPNGSSIEDYEKLVDTCVEQRICALICHSRSERFVRYLQQHLSPHGIHFGIVSNSYLPVGSLHVGSDDTHGVTLAMDYLHSLGHRRIANFNQDISFPYAVIRQNAFRDYMAKSKLEVPERYVYAGDDYEDMKRRFLNLMNSKCPPTAVVCGSDAIALLLMGTTWAAGFRIPDDVSFIGFGNFGFGRFTTPPLTTVYEPFVEMGEAIAGNMIGLVEHDKNVQMRQIIDSRLIIRDSVGKCNKE